MKAITLPQVAPRRLLLRAVLLSAAASLIHTIAAPLYFLQWLGYGAFFFTAATLQGLAAMLLLVSPPSRILLWAGIAGNGGVVLLWLITRTLGVPFFGPQAGQVLPVGVPDLAATLVELALIWHLAVLVRRFPEMDDEPLIK